jgi:hypothetical protein
MLARNQLAAVTWVTPIGQSSDHPGSARADSGPSRVAAVVNAVGQSQFWSNAAIIVTWDDWGGWYDHVPPPKVINDGKSWGSGYVYGFRVPLIVTLRQARVHLACKPRFWKHPQIYRGGLQRDRGKMIDLDTFGRSFGFAQCGVCDCPPNSRVICWRSLALIVRDGHNSRA